jgi:hypothetical protein
MRRCTRTPLRLVEILVEGVPHQAVGEGVAAERARDLAHQVGGARRGDRFKKARAREPRGRFEHAQACRATGDGGNGKDAAGAVVEWCETAADQGLDVVGHVQLDRSASSAVEPAGGGEDAAHLVDEERVAVGGLMHRAHDSGLGLDTEGPIGILADLALVEAAEVNPLGTACQIGQKRGAARVEIGPRRVVGRDQEDPRRPQLAGNEGEEQQRRRIGDVQVVDHDE